jgi:FAD/FMN-containing dehydrogenase
MRIAGSIFWRGEEGYEQARADAVWNARKPGRYPDMIVQALDEADVVAAVRLARMRGLKVMARSGGHGWTASSVRDGGMLIDLSRLTDVSLDPDTRTAVVSPGTRGRDLNRLLGIFHGYLVAD